MPWGVKLIKIYYLWHVETRLYAHNPFLLKGEGGLQTLMHLHTLNTLQCKGVVTGPIAQSRHELLFHQRENINRRAEPIGHQVPQSHRAYQDPTSFHFSVGYEY